MDIEVEMGAFLLGIFLGYFIRVVHARRRKWRQDRRGTMATDWRRGWRF